MSQTTTSIFASPGVVLPPVISTAGRAPTTVPKLVVTDVAGKTLATWDLKFAKGTLGSSESCSICCPFPGIAPIHALLVTGARQAFVRSLAGRITQDGNAVTELLLSDEKCYFEIAGYRFDLIRATVTQVETARKNVKRMQFALARPFNISSAPEQPQPDSDVKHIDAPWVANVIREAIEPLEAQIDSLLLPLAEFQSQSLQAQLSSAKLEEEHRAKNEIDRRAREQEIVGMVAQQSATMDTLTERIGDVNQQLSAIERIIAQDSQANSTAVNETSRVITVQQSAIEQLQSGMVSVSESLKQLQERQQAVQRENSVWKNEVQQQLHQLASAVSEFSSIAEGVDQTALVEAIESLKHTHEAAQLEIGRWQNGVQQQLTHLQHSLHESDNKSQVEIPAVIAQALSEIQAKHDQSLCELQSWKTELKLEMQHLLQSATEVATRNLTETFESFRSIEAQPAKSIDRPVVEQSLETRPIEDRSSEDRSSGNIQPSNPTATDVHIPIVEVANDVANPYPHPHQTDNVIPSIPEEPAWTSIGSSFDAGNSGADFGETLEQEIVDEELISQAQSEVAIETTQESSVDSQADQTNLDPSTQNSDPEWPTLSNQDSGSNTEPDSYGEQFSDQWSAQASVDLFENAASISEQPVWATETDSPTPDPAHISVDSAFVEYDPSSLTMHVNPAQSLNFSANPEQPNFEWNVPAEDAIENASSQQDLQEWNDPDLSTEGNCYNDDPSVESDLDRQPTPVQVANQDHLTPVADEIQSIDATEPSTTLQLSESCESSDSPEPRSGRSATLPSWWTEAEAEDQKQMDENHISTSTIPTTFDMGHLFEEPASGASSEIQSISQTAPHQTAEAEVEPAEEDSQFFGFGMGEPQETSEAQSAHKVMSIDQLAHLADEEDEPNNLFDFAREGAVGQTGQGMIGGDSLRGLPEPPANLPASSRPPQSTGQPEDDSVENYMKSLLARMRGETTEAAPPEKVAPISTPSSGYAPTIASQQSAARQQAEIGISASEQAEPIDFENYVPLTNAPEKGKNISALRDLANSTARTAIHKSTRRRTLSGSLMKFAISAIALTVAAALFAINGVAINIALIATMAALFVALIWGYDGLKSLKPLLQNSLVLQPIDNNRELNADDEEQVN